MEIKKLYSKFVSRVYIPLVTLGVIGILGYEFCELLNYNNKIRRATPILEKLADKNKDNVLSLGEQADALKRMSYDGPFSDGDFHLKTHLKPSRYQEPSRITYQRIESAIKSYEQDKGQEGF